MKLMVKGRYYEVSDELRETCEKRFRKIANQVSLLAELDLELLEERNPAISDRMVAMATLKLKGVTLRARAASPDMSASINHVVEELARQVKRHRDKRRKRREARGPAAIIPAPLEVDEALGGEL